ncbi:MAG: T9SS type A sorting domain-containing protein [Bacteroidota bacterium]|nr:T9SS type A sorting domain-containing protein [Bacteroidota bacterium]MDP4197848.1 T9SS type A sorting domain-containing protein [Bacteroidota bacterium]
MKLLRLLAIFIIFNVCTNAQQITIKYPLNKSIFSLADSYVQWTGPIYLNCIMKLSTDNGRTWIDLDLLNGKLYHKNTRNKLIIDSDSCKLWFSEIGNPTNMDSTRGCFTAYWPNFDTLDVNNIKVWTGSNGSGSNNPFSGQAGFYYPQGETGQWILSYSDGLLWNGKAGNVYRTGGNHLLNGLIPGRILSDGKPEDPASPQNRIWKLKRNWELLSNGPEKDKFEFNYYNWPVEAGAPWIDRNNDRKYEKGTDSPAILGDETIFYVANDLDSLRVSSLFNTSLPIGLEVQVTSFAYSSVPELQDAVFRRYRIINKSVYNITDMYFSYFGDPDIGSWMTDYVGCDTSLQMGYGYNSIAAENDYSGIPPAIGYMLLSGPIVPDNESRAIFDFKWRRNFKNLPMTSFTPLVKDYYNPPIPMVPRSTSDDIYKIVRGQNYNGENMTDPVTNKVTLFPLTGDPEKEKGWYEGKGWPGGPEPYSRWLTVNTGPFIFASKDTQEVVVAMVVARGSSYLNSVTELKNKAAAVRNFYFNNLITSAGEYVNTAINGFTLKQNYPNPFNPTTIINYSIPKKSHVELKVINMLGREVKTLINKEQNAGEYNVNFDGSSLPSGIYIYTIQAGQYRASRKLVLLK